MRKHRRGRRNIALILCFTALAVGGIVWLQDSDVLPIVPPEDTLASAAPAMVAKAPAIPVVPRENTVSAQAFEEPTLPPGFPVWEKRIVPMADTLERWLSLHDALPLIAYTDPESAWRERFPGIKVNSRGNFYWENLELFLKCGEPLYVKVGDELAAIPLTREPKDFLSREPWAYLYTSRYDGEDRKALNQFLNEVEQGVMSLAKPSGIRWEPFAEDRVWHAGQPRSERAYEG